MYKDYRYINAGTNEFHRWGKKAIAKLERALVPNENGFYCIPVDGGKYWSIGTSEGKYGEYARNGANFLSVNKAGYMWAKAGTEKADIFVNMINGMIQAMKDMKRKPVEDYDENEDEEF